MTNVDVTAEVGDTLGATQPMATTLAGILTEDDGGNKLIRDAGNGKDADKRY